VPEPSLELLQAQAKTLLGNVHARVPEDVERIFASHPHWRRFYKAKLAELFKRADAELIIARERGFSSWLQLQAALEGEAETPPPKAEKNPYFEVVDRVRIKNERLRSALIMSALPGRRTLVNRGQPLPPLKLEALLWGLEHESSPVRWFCLERLDAHPDPRAVPHILRRLDDPVPRVRWHAVHALACDACKAGQTLLTPEVAHRLREVAESDPSEKVRAHATYQLEQAQP
jgi:HEAT repeat protein